MRVICKSEAVTECTPPGTHLEIALWIVDQADLVLDVVKQLLEGRIARPLTSDLRQRAVFW
jgi:hypothetical protein